MWTHQRLLHRYTPLFRENIDALARQREHDGSMEENPPDLTPEQNKHNEEVYANHEKMNAVFKDVITTRKKCIKGQTNGTLTYTLTGLVTPIAEMNKEEHKNAFNQSVAKLEPPDGMPACYPIPKKCGRLCPNCWYDYVSELRTTRHMQPPKPSRADKKRARDEAKDLEAREKRTKTARDHLANIWVEAGENSSLQDAYDSMETRGIETYEQIQEEIRK